MTPQQEKKLAIAESIIHTASAIATHAKQLPVKNKYFFKRSYARGLSRQNKVNRKRALFNMAFLSMSGAMQIQQIIATPIPRFEKGSI